MNTKGTCMDEKITGVNVKGTFVGERAHVGMKRQICEQKGYTWVRKGTCGIQKGTCVDKKGICVKKKGASVNEKSSRVKENEHV